MNLDLKVSLCDLEGSNAKYVLVPLPLLGLDTSLVNLDAFDGDDLLPLRQELGIGGAVGEKKQECEEDDKGHGADDDHEPLPLVDFDRAVRRAGGSMVCSKCDKPGDNGSEAIALERPPDTLAHFSTVVEHGANKRDSRGDATLCHSKKKAKSD